MDRDEHARETAPIAPAVGNGKPRHQIKFSLETFSEYQAEIPTPEMAADPLSDNIMVWAHREIFGDTRAIGDFRSAYQHLDKQGILKWFGARDHGRTIGMITFMVTRSLHHAGHYDAVHNIFYVRSEYRGWIPVGLLRFAERKLGAMGVNTIFMGDRLTHDKPRGRIYQRMGYAEIERIYKKELGDRQEVAPPIARKS
jgi:GNAT superfamily N-acetyltransferase